MTDDRRQEGSALRAALRTGWRRRGLLLLGTALVPLLALGLSFQQQKLYRATSEVFLSRENIATRLTNSEDPNLSADPARLAQTQTDLAKVPEVARRVLQATDAQDRSVEDLLTRAEVSAKPNSDILEFSVTDPDRRAAVELAAAYAREFARYRRELDTAAVARALRDVQARIRELERRRQQRTPLFGNLVGKEQELRTLETLQTSNVFVVRPADRATQVQPRTIRNVILGLVLGVLMGVGLVFLWEALDTRPRSAREIEARLGLPLLARIPFVRHRGSRSPVLLAHSNPESHQAEAFRILRTNLDLAGVHVRPRSVLITSAIQGEGKSTVAASLAVALVRAGRRVLLVDMDLRRPSLHRLFGLDVERGLTSVALGDMDLGQAIQSVPVTLSGEDTPPEGNGRGDVAGTLEVLTSGPVAPNAGELVTSDPIKSLLGRLPSHADLVVLDSPPLLQVGDAMTLSSWVDGVLVVVGLRETRRPILDELRQVLETCPAPRLGFVLTGAELEEGPTEYASYKQYAPTVQRGSAG